MNLNRIAVSVTNFVYREYFIIWEPALQECYGCLQPRHRYTEGTGHDNDPGEWSI